MVARIIVSDNVSLDGVMQDPAGDEGFERGGWVGLIKDRPDLGRVTLDEIMGCEAMLMGRRTYEWFAGRWPSRTGPLADRLNSFPKYVVSSTLRDPAWTNTTVLTGDLVEAVTGLKDRIDGDVVVSASARIVRTLLEHDLVDEMRLRVFPVVLGDGERLFGSTERPHRMRLAGIETLDNDTAALTYRRIQPSQEPER